MVLLLLDHGADVDKAMIGTGTTPLYLACEKGVSDVVRALHEHGADINKVTPDTNTSPLMIVSQEGHLDIVRFLLKHGAELVPSAFESFFEL